jgi:hypothetical protein
MDTFVSSLVYELVRYRRAETVATRIFERLKHNDDLCPRFESKLNLILGGLKKYRRITYDTQGLQDKGTDVLLRDTAGQDPVYICLQIKSNDDMRNGDLMKDLKAQWVDSDKTFGEGLLDYYVILCCDSLNKKNKAKIRSVEADLSVMKKIHVIEPEYALAFLSLTTTTIDAVIRLKVGSEDEVLSKALSVVARLTPTERSVVFYILRRSIYDERSSTSVSELMNAEFINVTYRRTPQEDREWFLRKPRGRSKNQKRSIARVFAKDFESRLATDLEFLSDNLISQDGSGKFSIIAETVRPVAAVMLDGQLRYEHEGDQLLNYMMDVFGPQQGYETPGEL